MTRTQTRLSYALLASTALAGPAFGQTLPTAPSVAAGGVAISMPNASTMQIQQSTGTAIVNWQGFSVGQGATVNISQPTAQSALLNRVTGTTPSTIAGQINANGQVFLVNPNGIAITRTGVVNAGAFVASTLNTSDQDFLAGRRAFTGGGSSAAVVNEGTITIGSGGYAALIGGRVENSGTISVPLGRVGLASGEQVTLDLSGDGFLQVAVPSAGQPADKALIENSGRIRAQGGRVEMRAASVREAARNVINVSGLVEARTVSGRNGAIVLGGGEGGTVTVSGRLDASGGRRALAQGRASTARGGAITVTGDEIRLAGAQIDASGAGGGGQVRIGGDYQGGGALQRASTTTVDAGTTIRADALGSGEGGRVILWSDRLTTFDGLISARGGPGGGDGGFAEVSGKAVLAYGGVTDLTAPRGSFGTLLLDPYNVTISNNPDGGNTSAPGSLVTPIGPQTGTQFTPNANDSNINATTLTNALATANVNVTTGTGGTQAGNITVAAPLSWTSGSNLSLVASGGVFINAPINGGGSLGVQGPLGVSVNAPITLRTGGLAAVAGGNIAFNADINTAGGIFLSAGNTAAPAGAVGAVGTITATGAVNTAGEFRLSRGNWVQNSASLPAFSAGIFTILGDGTSASPASFLRTQGGNGSAANPYLITDVYGLQGIGSSANLLSSNYALANNINAAGTANWNSGAGFDPIGYTGGATTNLQPVFVPFTGNFNGNNFTISGLTINTPNNSGGTGLFGLVAGNATTISNLNLANVNITGGSSVGGLIGIVGFGIPGPGQTRFVNTTVSGVSVSGQVRGISNTGGLIGGLSISTGQGATISNSFSTASVGVSNSSSSNIGGHGGLIGSLTTYGGGSISVSNSYATGSVTGNGTTGGLIGRESILSYADITGSGLTDAIPRGQISTTNTFATGQVQTVSGSRAGGLIGRIDVPANTESGSGVTVATSYTVGNVVNTPGVTTGGLIGGTTGDSQRVTVTDSFWDTQATGQSTSATTGGNGAQGRTTAQLQDALPSGFSAAVYATGIDGQTSYPFLRNLPIPASILNSTGRGTPPPPPPPPVTADQPVVEQVLPLQVAAVSPTLSRQLAQAVSPVPANATSIEINVGGGGPSLGIGTTGLGGGGAATRSAAAETLNFVQRSSNDLERRLRQCEGSGQGYGNCVGAALDQFANAIDTRSLSLPGPLQNVAAVIREAARGVRAAPSVAAARAVVQTAVAEVRKAIALIRADDPAVGRLQLRQGNVIASALQSVDNRLARAVGL